MYKVFFLGCGKIFRKHNSAIDNLKNKFIKFGVYKDKIKFTKHVFGKKYLEQIKKSDVITILTPSGLHIQNINLCLKYKKYIIVEKPICLKLKELDKLISIPIYNKKIFPIFQNRLNRNIKRFKEKIDKKKLGKISLISGRMYLNRSKDYYKGDKWRGTWKFDGGVATNQAIHILDLVCWIFGDVKSVFARSSSFKNYIEAEDTIIINLKFKSGALGNLEFTTACTYNNYENSITVLGDEGLSKVYGINFEKLDFQFKNKKIQNLKTPKMSQDLHLESYRLIASVMDGKDKPPELAGLKECRKSLELLTAIYSSIENKKEITLPLKNYPKIMLGN